MKLTRTVALVAILVFIPLVALADTTGSVRGLIRCIDCLGQPPIEGVTVTVSGPNGIWNSTTDARGFYVIFGVAPGRYKISAYDPLYLPQLLYSQRPLCMHAGNYRDVDLYLGHGLQPQLSSD